MILVIGGQASGKKTYLRSLGFDVEGDRVASDVHELIPREADALEYVAGLVSQLSSKDAVTCCEVGSGVHPLTLEDRQWREAVGRMCNALADEATAVVRMVCGIPMVLKGEICS